MLLSTFTRVFAALAGILSTTTIIPGVDATSVKRYIDKDIYTKQIALGALERISTFRASHGKLTEAQSDALELLQHVVTSYDVSLVQDAEDACIAAFGREECRYFGTQHPAAASSDVAARALDCKCSTINSWCDKGVTCVSHRKNNCNYASYGCGTVWIYPCDGRCAK
ncbi:hypothetical protein V8F33_010422 [Rhypophila sp. PSN 637]